MLKNVSPRLIENVKDLKIALNELTVHDLSVYSMIELYYKVAHKLNEVIKELSRFEGVLSDEVIKQNEKLIYLLGEGLEIEVAKEIDNLIKKGFFEEIINEKIFSDLNNKIDTFKSENEKIFSDLNNKIDTFKSEIDSQLAHNVKYIKLSQLGLGTNPFDNLNIILSKLTSNNIIFDVDGDYEIATETIRELLYDLNIVSYNNGSLIFSNTVGETFFNIKSSINIENVNFINNTSSSKILFTTSEGNNSIIEKFKVVNSKFKGVFRLGYLTTCSEIKSVEILNNDIRNTTISFFQTSNFKINSVVISGNYVQNWLYRFISMTNFKNIENMVISNNTATNTDDWLLDKEVDSGTYYTFALVKAKKIHYYNNHVENMKSRYDVALYDCYAFADYYIYENNVFKNNICFDTSSVSVLMKCKNEGGYKVFKNNLFIIEDGFLTRFGVSKDDFKIKLYDIWGGYGGEAHTLPVEYLIDKNKIYVPNLQLEEGYRFVKNFIFTNNYIKCSNIYNSLVKSKHVDAFIKISNNHFENEKGDEFSLISGKSEAKYSSVEISNNIINALRYGIASSSVNKCILINNIVNCNYADGLCCLTTYLTSDSTVSKNNVLNGVANIYDHNNFSVVSDLINYDYGKIKSSSIYLHNLDTTTVKTIKISVIGINVKSVFNVSVSDGIVTFVDANGNKRDLNILTSSGHGVSLKNEGEGSATVVFHNSTTYTRLTLATNTEEFVEIRVHIV